MVIPTENRLAEARKQIGIAADDLEDPSRIEALREAEAIVENVETAMRGEEQPPVSSSHE